MDEAWPDWAQQAWRSIPSRQQAPARRVWETIAHAYGGVLVGPGALVRKLVDEAGLGHRSTLETIARMVEAGLLEARTAAEGTVLWVPRELLPDPPAVPSSYRRPRFQAGARSNGHRSPAGAPS